MPDPDLYDDVGRRYSAALAKSRRRSLVMITAYVLKGWTDDEIHHYIETGEQPAGKELE